MLHGFHCTTVGGLLHHLGCYCHMGLITADNGLIPSEYDGVGHFHNNEFKKNFMNGTKPCNHRIKLSFISPVPAVKQKVRCDLHAALIKAACVY